MARFYDRVCRKHKSFYGLSVIAVDNVHNHLASGHSGNIEGVACIKPPFKKCWIEWKESNQYTGIRVVNYDRHSKAADNDYDPDDPIVPFITKFGLDLFSNNHLLSEVYSDDVRSDLPYMVIVTPYDDSGKPIDKSNYFFPFDLQNVSRNSGLSVDEIKAQLGDEGEWYQLILFFSLTFLNVKNTVLIDNPPPAKLSKRHEKKYGVPLVTYKTLKVLPMRKVNQNDYDADDTNNVSIPKSLHIARGHFKDYRNGPGLFGKFQDIFWWDAHVRGNAEKGVVVKDYDVIAPEVS